MATPDNIDSRVILSDATTVAAGSGVPSVRAAKTYQGTGTTTAGAGAATIQVQGSNDGVVWDATPISTITLTLGTTATGDGFTSIDGYAFVRGNVTAISGTGAAVSLIMGF